MNQQLVIAIINAYLREDVKEMTDLEIAFSRLIWFSATANLSGGEEYQSIDPARVESRK